MNYEVYFFSNVYSYLKASIGESREARLAGAAPKIRPTRVETPNAKMTELTVTLAGK